MTQQHASEKQITAFRMKLNHGEAAAYRRRHNEIWPELVRALRDAGATDYRIFLDEETDILFAVLTAITEHRLAGLRQSPLMHRWWAMMSDIMETNPDQSPREWELVPMFDLAAIP